MSNLDDIQGNILAGFNTNFQVFAGLTNNTEDAWQEIAFWLAARAPELTSVNQVREQRRPIRDMDRLQDISWLSLALSYKVFSKTSPDVLFNDAAFRLGMVRRAGPLLGDRTPQTSWKIGGENNPIDILLTIGANDRNTAEERATELINSAKLAGLKQTYFETAERNKDLEHFGFRDGISQPTVKGFDLDGELEMGNFVFGYPKVEGGTAEFAGTDPRQLTANGSLLVIRRLNQDVQKFRSFCDQKALELQLHLPGVTGEHVQALIVGRWPNGALVSFTQSADPGAIPDDNVFDFSDDQDGKGCPFGGHIRKVNPRKGPKDVVDVPRLLRRGIPYGKPFEEEPQGEKGLMFVSYQTSIEDTFEFISAKWMNGVDRPGRQPGNDLLVGRSNLNRSLKLSCPLGEVNISDDKQNWVIPTGGAYLFSPGKAGLSRIADRPQVSFSIGVKRLILDLKDSFF
ncbi:Dyp-type peroxidase [Pedobacter sp. HDW13]|uniref:Dyp-type peroxidase n=1 Tax=Pedobacter sp. HDW13 TaxID=2714940 RepID=UPI00140CA93F|nr:Dyp-type peroxidase [Pedobacter sp. HDW13]QIL38336.1 Dyp-type peroxidase [Pedobacter sp. HDW13]